MATATTSSMPPPQQPSPLSTLEESATPPMPPAPLSALEERRRRALAAFDFCQKLYDDWERQVGRAHAAGSCACCSSNNTDLGRIDAAMAERVAWIREGELEKPYMVRK